VIFQRLWETAFGEYYSLCPILGLETNIELDFRLSVLLLYLVMAILMKE
jgi:hypothetical protein